jgi:hypothetical protein
MAPLAGGWLGRNIGSAIKAVLPGTALTAGFGAMGAGPKGALVYGLSDIATSLPATLLGRYAGRNIKSQPVRNAIETGANIIGSLIGTEVGSSVLMAGQPQQIAQQIEQRSVVNQLPLSQQLSELSPGTQYQLPAADPQHFENLLGQTPRNQWMQYLSPEDQAMLQGALNPRL